MPVTTPVDTPSTVFDVADLIVGDRRLEVFEVFFREDIFLVILFVGLRVCVGVLCESE